MSGFEVRVNGERVGTVALEKTGEKNPGVICAIIAWIRKDLVESQDHENQETTSFTVSGRCKNSDSVTYGVKDLQPSF